MSHIRSLFEEKGSDCWWELPLETLLPEEVLEKVGSRLSLTVSQLQLDNLLVQDIMKAQILLTSLKGCSLSASNHQEKSTDTLKQ